MKLAGVISFLALLVLCGITAIQGCRKKEFNFGQTPLPFNIPEGFPSPYNHMGRALQTEEVFQLGRRLFYEGKLSIDGQHSCGSCHQPEAVFTTHEHDRSHGIGSAHTLRNAPGLFNLAWQPIFYRDGSRQSMDEVARKHITAPDEMGETIPSVLGKLRSDTMYRRLFREAYGTNNIEEQQMLDALRVFQLHLISADAPFDRERNGRGTLSAAAISGRTIFQQKCAGCHQGLLFTDNSFRNTGWPVNTMLNDHGRMLFTRLPEDSLKFRVPSLRNVALSAYYLHDGRRATFRAVINHYTQPENDPRIDASIRSGIPLTTLEEDNLLAFLFSLSDSAFLNNPRFRQP